MGSFQQVIDDLRYIFRQMPLACLKHLQQNRGRLIRGKYTTADGGGCIFSLLTEILPESQRINSRESLIRFFGGNPQSEHYQPAKWIVRLWDYSICEGVRQRYGDCEHLSRRTLFQVLDEVIAERTQPSVSVAVPRPAAQKRAETLHAGV